MEDVERVLVALVRAIEQHPRVGIRAEHRLRVGGRRESGRVGFQMPSPRAGPLTWTPVVLDHDVPELGCGAERAAVGTSVEDQPTTDAGAERQHDHVARPAPGAGLPLADGSGVRVVVDSAGQTEALAEQCAQRHLGQRDVHRGDRGPGCLVDRRGHAEADRVDAVASEALDRIADGGDDSLLGRRRGGHLA